MRALLPILGLWLVTLGATPGARAQNPVMPVELEGTEITEHLGAKLPLDLHFTDENSNDVTLRDYFHAGRPVILTLNYYECPMLCSMVLDGLIKGLSALAWSPGVEFDIVTVSINQPRGAGARVRQKEDAPRGARQADRGEGLALPDG